MITRLEFKNWMRFGGEHVVDLGPGVYAVTAQLDGDVERSNWLGKSSVLESIRFALKGAHRFAREDEWITEGEREGSVVVTLAGGVRIVRSRKIGQSTQLSVKMPDGTATGDAGQVVLDKLVGLSLSDFDATCWFGQKQLSRLVTSKPAPRMEIVAGWLALEPVQRCEERARVVLSARMKELVDHEQKLAAVNRAITELLGDVPVEKAELASLSLRRAADHAEAAAERAGVVLQDAERVADGQQQAAERVRQRQELARLKTTAGELTAQIRELGGPKAVEAAKTAAEAAATAKGAEQVALVELRKRSSVAGGKFDGACPVLSGFACPAQADINTQRQRLADAHTDAKRVHDEVAAQSAEALRASATAAKTAQDALSLRERRAAIGEQITKLEATLGAALPVPEPQVGAPALVDARSAATTAEARWKGLVAAVGRVESLEQEAEGLRVRIAAAREGADLGRAAVAVFGRRGAQRVIAERGLGAIERGANLLLRKSGIDLGVTMRWAREGAGLATTCDACGAAYPASQKVKRCERCGDERGPKMVERLDVEMTDVSGAAEDLGGAALQLAASAWLRRERGAQWSVALIDEPFSSLDAANRRAFATHLATMLTGEYGFTQAFVVAHQLDVVDALPHRLRVVATEEGSAFGGVE